MNVKCFFMMKNTYLHINSFIFKYMHWVWGIENDVRGEEPYELPPSRGCPCSVENIKLFSKQREAQYDNSLYSYVLYIPVILKCMSIS
jgi:hypothetical protein